MSSPITVVYSFDRNYAHQAAVSVYSLALHATSELQVVWIVPVSDEASVIPTASHIAQKTGVPIRLISVPKDNFSECTSHDQYSSATFLRLIVADLIPEPRAIHLDPDTLVQTDLRALWETDLGDNVIAGVSDPVAADMSRIPRSNGDTYINAGVLLMNLDALRTSGLKEKARDMYREYAADLVFLDQCILNKFAEGRKLTLHDGWNRMICSRDTTSAEFDDHLKQPGLAILHFAGKIKPWAKWSNADIAEFWWRYANQAEVEGLVPTEMKSIGDTWNFSLMLERNQRFEEACREKARIIERLIGMLEGSARKSPQNSIASL
jgi:lipopolysaccharide biosynthesis glycosyltransferase